MRKKVRIFSFALAINLLFLSFSGFSSANETTEIIDKVRDTKILSTATVDQDFDDSSVLVIMDNIAGGINKSHDLSYFGDIGATSVTDLTVLSNETLVASGLASKATTDDTTVSANKLPWFEVNEETFRQILKIELSVHSKENVLNVINQLEKIEGIKYAGPNYNMYLYSENIDAARSLSNEANDYPWGIIKTSTVDAWDITVGSDKIKVGVIDSGIAEHPNLVDNLVAGSNFYDNLGTEDFDGHGTQIAGIIGAVAGNGFDVQGVCKNVSTVPLKVYLKKEYNAELDAYVAKVSSLVILRAIEYATNNGIHVLNYSIGDKTDDPIIAQAILNYPGLFVAAAGNEGVDTDVIDNRIYPAGYSMVLDNVISVSGTYYHKFDETSDAEYPHGDLNYGAESVDLFAPGYLLTTTSIDDEEIEVTGTSFAAPFVAGAAALIMSVRPDMTPAEVKKCIMDSVDKSEEYEGKCVSGGRLNVYRAVQLATQPQTFTGDVNGDGMADMIVTRRLSNGNRAIDTYLGQSDGKYNTVVTREYTQAYNYEDPVFTGDANGDGLTDLIVHSVVGGKRYLFIYRGNTDVAFTGAMLTATNDNHDYYSTKAKFFVADVNGDGNDDFIVHTKNSSGKRINLTYLSKVAGTTAAFSNTASTFTSTNNHGTSPVYIGDFNGDGMADMVVPHKNSSGKRCLLVYKGKSSAPYFSSGVKFNSSRNHDPLQWPCQYFVNDVNGDGKDDLVVHWKNANGKRNNLVYKGGSSGLMTEAVATAATSNNYIATDPVFVGDINGDGYGDMLVQWANSYNQRNMLVYRGTSSATYGTGTNYNMGDTLDLPEMPSCFFLADATGDGRMDFIVKYRSGSGMGNVGFITYAGTASGSFSAGAYSNLSTSGPAYFNN